MKIRPYIYGADFESVKAFGTDERTHALWSANIFRYPLAQESFESKLRELEKTSGDMSFIAENDNGEAVGFFCIALYNEGRDAMLKFVIVSPSHRGEGLGLQMVKAAAAFSFEHTDAAAVTLKVFSVNEKARRCYTAAGFAESDVEPGAFAYNGEIWGRCSMRLEADGQK